LFITAKALPPARTNATVSAITSDVFMAKLACFTPPEPATRQVNRDVDERAMNTDRGWRTAGISFAPGMAWEVVV
jgi:hypothetical protein